MTNHCEFHAPKEVKLFFGSYDGSHDKKIFGPESARCLLGLLMTRSEPKMALQNWRVERQVGAQFVLDLV
jgi:hypothetical protein